MDGSTHITDVLKACSDFTRLRMMRLLVTSGAELCVGELVQSLQGRPYNISKQLKVLEHAGMVARKKQGRHVYYQRGLGKEPVAEVLFRFIDQLPDEDGEFEADRVRLADVLERRDLRDVSESGVGESSAEGAPKRKLDTTVSTPEDDGGDLPSYLL